MGHWRIEKIIQAQGERSFCACHLFIRSFWGGWTRSAGFFREEWTLLRSWKKVRRGQQCICNGNLLLTAALPGKINKHTWYLHLWLPRHRWRRYRWACEWGFSPAKLLEERAWLFRCQFLYYSLSTFLLGFAVIVSFEGVLRFLLGKFPCFSGYRGKTCQGEPR